jgi:hypothetical protein
MYDPSTGRFTQRDPLIRYVLTIGEMYYSIVLKENLVLTFDVQTVANPGYNQARGPVAAIWAIRIHVSF